MKENFHPLIFKSNMLMRGFMCAKFRTTKIDSDDHLQDSTKICTLCKLSRHHIDEVVTGILPHELRNPYLSTLALAFINCLYKTTRSLSHSGRLTLM